MRSTILGVMVEEKTQALDATRRQQPRQDEEDRDHAGQVLLPAEMKVDEAEAWEEVSSKVRIRRW